MFHASTLGIRRGKALAGLIMLVALHLWFAIHHLGGIHYTTQLAKRATQVIKLAQAPSFLGVLNLDLTPWKVERSGKGRAWVQG